MLHSVSDFIRVTNHTDPSTLKQTAPWEITCDWCSCTWSSQNTVATAESWNFKWPVWQSRECLMLLSFELSTTPSGCYKGAKCLVILSVSSARYSQNALSVYLWSIGLCSLWFSNGFNTNLAVSPLTQFLNSIWYWISASVHAALANLYPHIKRMGTGPDEKACCFTTSKHCQCVQTICKSHKVHFFQWKLLNSNKLDISQGFKSWAITAYHFTPNSFIFWTDPFRCCFLKMFMPKEITYHCGIWDMWNQSWRPASVEEESLTPINIGHKKKIYFSRASRKSSLCVRYVWQTHSSVLFSFCLWQSCVNLGRAPWANGWSWILRDPLFRVFGRERNFLLLNWKVGGSEV